MKIFEFQNDVLKTNLQTKFSVKCLALGPKVTTKTMFVINFNFEWITLAVKQISEITKKLIWVIKEQNMQTFILHPIFASIRVQKWTSVKHDLFHRLARDRKSPWQRRNRSLIFSGKHWFGGSLVDKQLAFNGTLLEVNNKIQQSSHLGRHATLCRDELPLNVNRNSRKVVYTKLRKYSAEVDDVFSRLT